ncbi:phosphoprotein associated with glycosphingolipid-enriched microdomains 1 [Scleropages formosus]|uniref:Phosphoprotein membrane anchor with glycosphingolipid microdomains 1 n=1 Tax=Scleropages formosus TaxID=113540 RepID=A0A8C9QY55_SCLFO|nr:phosphoprotein associated with glycosphingolipid-enriched microdomains 1 [Scleropages formosus]XP_018582742.1 phosphoprotein associated with glycosphingolipid-enriched microdomains 1 [Scleropages formosus]XP_018582743.1 phosphoprotein associated with glycosphingolipid-enriched microdomains 1 [Scleropages formosus]XP_018582744.1 phosphoprotein associated with glycosphingolipid-enriched microdomains 1 [Scleropages formosus]XP_029104165.1 phosphoprotein associated with glycosphingolipid-enriche
MAPIPNALWDAEVMGAGAQAGGHLVFVGTLTALSAFLLLLALLLLCASCQGQKKTTGHTGDHDNLMNGMSEKEAFTQSVESAATDLVASSSQNGPLTSGTVLTDDTLDNSPQPSEDMLSSQSELRSSKCPQDRQLPSIPPTGTQEGSAADPQAASGDGTYEVVKESASRDVSVEDSLYETVKELKDPERRELPNGTSAPVLGGEPCPPVLNGGLSPGSRARAPLSEGAEYASVDLNKKSRYSADLESRRSAPPPADEPEESEEERPPPIPDKVLDENENQQPAQGSAEGLQNGEVNHLPPSTSINGDPQLSEKELSALYSSIAKPSVVQKENDYSSIGEIKSEISQSLSESGSGDLYATVKDINWHPEPGGLPEHQEDSPEPADPGYETIKIAASGDKDAGTGKEALAQREPDYESVGDLELNREISRL